jgi:hypothetical protein
VITNPAAIGAGGADSQNAQANRRVESGGQCYASSTKSHHSSWIIVGTYRTSGGYREVSSGQEEVCKRRVCEWWGAVEGSDYAVEANIGVIGHGDIYCSAGAGSTGPGRCSSASLADIACRCDRIAGRVAAAQSKNRAEAATGS